jgi:hypothetical protein
MRLLANWLGKKEEVVSTVTSGSEIEPFFRNDDLPDTLNLGWYWSEGRQEFQMMKIANKDRFIHLYCCGASGSGKTRFLEFLIQQDIENRSGFGVISPHADLISDIKGFLACYAEYVGDESLFERVVVIDPTDPVHTVIFNVLESPPGISATKQAGELITAFKRVWEDSWGPRMEDLLRNSLAALGESGLTLGDLPQFLTSQRFRSPVLEKVRNPIAKAYFERFDSLSNRDRLTRMEPVMNKVNAFLSDDRIRQMLSHSKSSFNLREIMGQGMVLLINTDKGQLGDEPSDLLNALFMAKIQMAAFSRSDVTESQRVPWMLYIDEFQNFVSDSFAVVLSEARKYRLALAMAHQSLEQVPRDIRSIILGNTGVQVYFRINRQDAEILAKEGFEYSGYEVKTMSVAGGTRYWTLGEEWEQHIEELQNLLPRFCYVKHKIEGGMVPIQTAEIVPPHEVLAMEEGEYQEYLDGLPIGRKFVVDRAELVGQEGSQIRDGLKAQGLVEEIETRMGKGGRLAKIIVPTFKALEMLGKEPPAGRGGMVHRYVQLMVVSGAKKKGYKAEVEKDLGNGGIADVHLEKGGQRIAVEVAVVSKPERETDHMKRCLDAGYDRVFDIFADEGLLVRTQEAMTGLFSDKEMSKVRLLPLRKLEGFFS